MIITRLMGGLGNQMFQYAFGRSLSLVRDCPLQVDTSLLEIAKKSGLTPREYNLDIFKAPLRLIDIHMSNLEDSEAVLVEERRFHHDPELVGQISDLPSDKIIVLQGYWQSPKYFDTYWSVILNDFRPRHSFVERWERIAGRIRSTESVMVHVRRGDFLEHLEHHLVVSRRYLLDAIEMVKTEFPNTVFFVFSDDIPWCRDNIPTREDTILVDERYYDQGCQFYFQLMCLCKHFITANSTFSWWAAYLGEKEGSTIIAPDPWAEIDFDARDLIPSSWKRIEK